MPKPTILIEGYDPEKPTSHILYLDANNLYGWAMSQYLLTGGFRWEEDCKSLAESIDSHPSDSPEGHILEVDLEYPEDLHDAHNAYPLAQERMMVQKKWMSDYQHDLLGVGRRQQRLRCWSQTSATRSSMCFTIGICSCTCLCACV